MKLTACPGTCNEGIWVRIPPVLTSRGAVGSLILGGCFDIVVWPMVGRGVPKAFGVIMRTCVCPMVVVWLGPIGRICACIFYKENRK